MNTGKGVEVDNEPKLELRMPIYSVINPFYCVSHFVVILLFLLLMIALIYIENRFAILGIFGGSNLYVIATIGLFVGTYAGTLASAKSELYLRTHDKTSGRNLIAFMGELLSDLRFQLIRVEIDQWLYDYKYRDFEKKLKLQGWSVQLLLSDGYIKVIGPRTVLKLIMHRVAARFVGSTSSAPT